MSAEKKKAPVPCPSCETNVTGRFCPKCGTLARAMPCAACGTTVQPGDEYCEECGTATRAGDATVSAAPAQAWKPGPGWWLGTGALALTLIVALYIRFSGEEPTPAGSAATAAAMQAGRAGGPGMDVLSMPPEQQAAAMFDRVMRLSEEGKKDSVAFFAPMALGLYEQLQPLDLHHRYDFGAIALAAGKLPIARAQADTILQNDPNHLLGLALLSRVSRTAGAQADAEKADARFRQAADGELKKKEQKPEYQGHKYDIDTELKRLAGQAK